MPEFRHVVLFQLREGADPEQAIRLLEESRPDEALAWVIQRSIDERKGIVIVEDATFVDKDAFDAFRASEVHRRLTDHMSQWADWLVGDWTTS